MADHDQQKNLDPGRTSGRLQKDCLPGGSPIVHGRIYQRSTSEGSRTAAHPTGRCVRRLKAWSIGQLIATTHESSTPHRPRKQWVKNMLTILPNRIRKRIPFRVRPQLLCADDTSNSGSEKKLLFRQSARRPRDKADADYSDSAGATMAVCTSSSVSTSIIRS